MSAASELADAQIDLYVDDLHRAAALPPQARAAVPGRIAEQIRRMGWRASTELATRAVFRLAQLTWNPTPTGPIQIQPDADA